MAEIEAVWCLQAASKETQECREGAAVLMDLAGVEQRQEVSEPTSRATVTGVTGARRGVSRLSGRLPVFAFRTTFSRYVP